MISLIYFLLASCFLIGCFANFAGNGYGFTLAILASSAFAVFLLPRGLYAAIKSWKGSRLKALRLLTEYWLAALGLFGILLKFNHSFGAGITMIAGFLLLSLFYFFSSLITLYKLLKPGGRLARTNQFLILLFCSVGFFSTLAKFMHWPALAGLLLTLPILLLIIFVRIAGRIFSSGSIPKSAIETLSPVQSYFYILLVGNLHFWGSIKGWIPGFQFPDRSVQWVKMKEEPESPQRDSRMDFLNQNTAIFFLKRNSNSMTKPGDSMDFLIENTGNSHPDMR
jgi:hypothetical protein